ncbi:MAG: hypothetical protein KA533_02475 [Sphingobium sp.]|nr:hypothetical protein [Sphingobium sp.]MBP6113078.1 hypothetical protein [Sphingobium sp.]MBP8672207.1 hypothetical protein [Sphingobium sp.]MBP9156341.1 hypothetical protein [Sphingobium sp.]
MSVEPFTITLRRERRPDRIRVAIEPPRVDFSPARYVLDEHAEAAAALLRDKTGFAIADLREARP